MGLFSFRQPKKPNVKKATRGSQGGVIGGDELQGFLDDQELLFVTSSNLAAAQFFPDSSELMVEYLNGDAWIYGNISRSEAEAFARAPSKGEWVWSHIKVRGTKDQHQKPARKIR